MRALGFYLPSRECTQVSMNLTRPEETTIPDAYDLVSEQARQRDISVIGAEVVGICPEAALGGRDPASIGLTKKLLLLEEVRANSTN